MLTKITDQRLLSAIIIVFLLIQFALAITGHRQIDSDIHLMAAGQLAPDCDHPFSNAIESQNH